MSAASQALWARLREATLVDGVVAPASEAAAPWFVRAMLGIAGWIGALFLLGFVSIGLFAADNAASRFVVGVLACAAASVLFRVAPRSDFASQFAFAVSLAGQGLIAWALFQWLGEDHRGYGRGGWERATLACAAVQWLLFFLAPNFIHRVFTAWSGAYAATFALKAGVLTVIVPAALSAVCLAVWLLEFTYPRRSALLRAAGYGLALAVVQSILEPSVMHMSLLWGLGRTVPGRVDWIGPAAHALVFVGAMLALLRREGVALDSGPGAGALASAALLGLIALKAPGLAPAVGILVVGYANGNRVLAGLGVIGMLGYLSFYYYSLQATLLEKSALLAAAGVALLVARFALQRWWPPSEAADA